MNIGSRPHVIEFVGVGGAIDKVVRAGLQVQGNRHMTRIHECSFFCM